VPDTPEHEGRTRAEILAGQPDHVYVSTACQHQLCTECRRTCKFCAVSCYCPCHGTQDQLSVR
jgi:hypothetical protein